MLQIRKASTGDIDAIHDIIMAYASEGVILERSKAEIRQAIPHFLVGEENGVIVGIISYYDYGSHLKEVRSLGVAREHARKGAGSQLLRALIAKIHQAGKNRVFALTYSPEFFLKNGFSEVPKETLPEKIWKDCSRCRHRDNCTEVAVIYG